MKRFSSEQYAQALESWSWLDLEGKTPRFASLFGDLFLEATDAWWFLDTMDGTVSREWQSETDVQQAMNTAEGQDRFLMLALARDAERRDVTLQPNEVYSLTPPPVLGGPLDAANVSAVDVVVAVNIAGQIHDQVRNLPPGTPVSEITIT